MTLQTTKVYSAAGTKYPQICTSGNQEIYRL